MFLIAALGLVVSLAPSVIVPRYGFNAYLLLIAVAVVTLVVVARR